MTEIHRSRWLTKTGAISTGPDGFWECTCGKRFKARESLRRHLRGNLKFSGTVVWTPERGWQDPPGSVRKFP